MTGPDSAVLRGRMDAQGRLVSADPALLALQIDAGGTAGGPLLLPGLAHLARVVQRMGAAISRPVTIGDTEGDRTFWVRIRPAADGTDLTLLDQGAAPRMPAERSGLTTLAVLTALRGDGWAWTTDAALCFTSFSAQGQETCHDLPRVGEPLTAFFRLVEREEVEGERLPLLAAALTGRPFSGQPAVARAAPTVRYMLAALPLRDARGRLAGYRGKALPAETNAERVAAATALPGAELADFPADFGRRLDHALRQPLGRIIANANTISGQMEGPLRSDYAGYASDIAVAGRHLLALVDDLADLQAIERPDFTAEREQVDLADLGRRAAGLLKVRASERAIAIKTPESGETLFAIGEYRRVLQILVNLIGNAVRYSPDGGEVWVRVDDDPARHVASLVVADQGQGIDPADHERIFARFERLQPDDGAGTGLGLYISRRLARVMGGDIMVESAPGQGARFTLTLPLDGSAG